MDKTVEAMKRLKAMRGYLTRAQCTTIKGQILSGDIDGAMKGLDRIYITRWRYGPETKRELNTGRA